MMVKAKKFGERESTLAIWLRGGLRNGAFVVAACRSRCDAIVSTEADSPAQGGKASFRGRRNARDHPPNLWITLWAIPGTKPRNRLSAEDAWKLPANCALAKVGHFQPNSRLRRRLGMGEAWAPSAFSAAWG